MHAFVSDRIYLKELKDLAHSMQSGLYVTGAMATWRTPPKLLNR